MDTALLLVAWGGIGLVGLLWLLLLAGAGRWGQGYGLDPEGSLPAGAPPKLSVVIPARNEAGRVISCVRAALAQDYGGDAAMEVIVVDDGSDDGTGDEARSVGGDVIVLTPRARPEGWAGKAWACQHGAAQATGELLLFIDADVRLAPWAARAAAARLLSDDVDWLSLFGRWELGSLWERVLVPVVGWFIRGAVDLAEANAPTGPAERAFANGQFLLVRRSAYDAIDGHGAVRGEVLDDVRMAQALRRSGAPGRLLCAAGPSPAFTVRLYESLGEIVRGYSKNLYEGMDRRPGVAVAAVVFIGLTTLAPWGLLAAPPPWRWAGVALCALQLVFRWRLERLDGRPLAPLVALTHPVGNALFIGILLRSAFGGPVQWKGRDFVGGKAA